MRRRPRPWPRCPPPPAAPGWSPRPPDLVVILGLLLAAAGWIFGVEALEIVGVMVVICGLILLFLGADRTGGHRWW
jgi:hypothetical protein